MAGMRSTCERRARRKVQPQHCQPCFSPCLGQTRDSNPCNTFYWMVAGCNKGMLWSLNISWPHEVIYWYRQHFQNQSMLSQCCQLCSCCCCCQHCPHQGGPFPLHSLLCQTLHLISRILPCLFCHCSQRHCAFCSLCFLLMRGTASSQFGPQRATCPPRIRPAGGVPTHRPRPWGPSLQSLPPEPEVAPAPSSLAMAGQQEALLGRGLCGGNPPTHAVDGPSRCPRPRLDSRIF